MYKKLFIVGLLSYLNIEPSDFKNSFLVAIPDENGLYDNGILGRGFITKDSSAQNRERILDTIRREHDDIVMQYTDCYSILESVLNCCKHILFGKDIHPITGDSRVQEKLIIKPVIKEFLYAPTDIVAAMGGQVKLRSHLHQLREQLDPGTLKSKESCDIYLDNDDQEGNEIVRLFHENPSGIIFIYTDRQLIRIKYDEHKRCFVYSKKNLD